MRARNALTQLKHFRVFFLNLLSAIPYFLFLLGFSPALALGAALRVLFDLAVLGFALANATNGTLFREVARPVLAPNDCANARTYREKGRKGMEAVTFFHGTL